MGKKVKIELLVETADLWPIDDPTPQQYNMYCGLKDDNGGCAPGGNLENFQSLVFIDNNVEWSGESISINPSRQISKNNDFSIEIVSIAHESKGGDKDFFDNTVMQGPGGPNAKVTAKVKDNPDLLATLDVYTINFKIHRKSDGHSKPYSIDPKLQGHN